MLTGKLADMYTDLKTKKNVDSALYKIKAVLKKEDKEFLSEIGIVTKGVRTKYQSVLFRKGWIC